MQLTILGSGTGVIKQGKKSSSYLLEIDSQKLLIDCGWSAPVNVYEGVFAPRDIDHIFITHPHADHLGGLMSLMQSQFVSGLYYEGTGRTKPLTLHGYQRFTQDYELLRTIMMPERSEQYEVTVLEYLNTRQEFADFVVTSREVYHVPEFFHAVAFRIDADGKSFVYSGDCGYDPHLIDLARHADVLVCEMAVAPHLYRKFGPRPNHLSAVDCGKIAAMAEVRKLIISHRYEYEDEKAIRSDIDLHFQGEVVIASDLQQIQI